MLPRMDVPPDLPREQIAKSIRLALTTIDTRDAAESLANTLIERKLTACVNILGPIHSVYRWKEKIEHADEFLLVMKTDNANLAELEQAVRSLHSYQTPEFLVLDIAAASESYAQWLLASLAR